MKYIIATTLSFFLMSCSIFKKNENYKNDWNLFSQTEIGKDSPETMRKKFGEPDEIDNDKSLPEHMGANEEQWDYMRKGTSKIGMYFNNGILEAINMDVWEGEEIIVLSTLLDKFPGKWRVEQEKPVSAHFMPFLCYMIDDSSGKEVEIHGYKKTVESVSKCSPKILKKRERHRKKAKIYPDVDPNRCGWLKDFLKTKGLLAN